MFVTKKKYNDLLQKYHTALTKNKELGDCRRELQSELTQVKKAYEDVYSQFVRADLRASNMYSELISIKVPKMTKAEIKRSLNEIIKNYKQ